jgi:octaprenyl-diphosphate synthase
MSLIGSDWSRMQTLLRDSLHTDVGLLGDINGSLLSNSGKMLRPMLTLLVAKACSDGEPGEESVRKAAAVEILHNATLLHDDVADEAMIRRGSPTVMSRLGPVPAVLVGDFWLASAVGLVAESSDLKWTLRKFGRTLTDLAEGEMLQQQKAFLADTTEEEYLRIIYCKTASLFVIACESGAKSVAAPDALMAAAGDYGRALGMAFQIRDDILDYSGGEKTGKPVGIDLREQKITLPLLGALRTLSGEEEVRKMIRGIHDHPDDLGRLHDFVLRSGGVEYAENKLKEYVAAALHALEAFPASAAREVLAGIAEESADRTK